jgi:hypothetical protein
MKDFIELAIIFYSPADDPKNHYWWKKIYMNRQNNYRNKSAKERKITFFPVFS